MGKMFSKSKPKHSKYSGGVLKEQNPHSTGFHQISPIHEEPVTSLASVDGEHCLSGSKDQTMCLFNLSSCTTQVKWNAHESEVTKVAHRPGSELYFSASRDHLVKSWTQDSTDPVHVYSGHELVVTGLALNTDGRQLVSGSRDNSMRLWDVATSSLLLQHTISRNLITHVHWAVGTDMIAQTGEDKEVRIWDARTLRVSHTFLRKQYIQTYCDVSDHHLLTSSNGFGGSGSEATLWDIRTSSPLHEFKGHRETVGSCVFLPSYAGRHLLATCSNDCSVKIWDRDTTECLVTEVIPGSGPLTSLAVLAAPNRTRLCVGSFNAGITVLDVSSAINACITLNKTLQF